MSPATVAALNSNVVLRGRDVMRLMDVVKDDTAMELGAALSGASVRRIAAADIPGASAYGLSRAINGSDSNPLFRLVAIMVLLKRLGMPRARAQRIVDFFQACVDAIWGPAEDEVEKKDANNEATK